MTQKGLKDEFISAMLDFADIADELLAVQETLSTIDVSFRTPEYDRLMARIKHAMTAVKFIETNSANASAIVAKYSKGREIGAHANTIKGALNAVKVGSFALSAICHEAQTFHARTLNPNFKEAGLGSMIGAALSLYDQFACMREH